MVGKSTLKLEISSVNGRVLTIGYCTYLRNRGRKTYHWGKRLKVGNPTSVIGQENLPLGLDI